MKNSPSSTCRVNGISWTTVLLFFSFFLTFYLSFYHWKQSKQRYVLFFSFFFGVALSTGNPRRLIGLWFALKKKIKSEIIDRFIEHLDDQDDERCWTVFHCFAADWWNVSHDGAPHGSVDDFDGFSWVHHLWIASKFGSRRLSDPLGPWGVLKK